MSQMGLFAMPQLIVRVMRYWSGPTKVTAVLLAMVAFPSLNLAHVKIASVSYHTLVSACTPVYVIHINSFVYIDVYSVSALHIRTSRNSPASPALAGSLFYSVKMDSL